MELERGKLAGGEVGRLGDSCWIESEEDRGDVPGYIAPLPLSFPLSSPALSLSAERYRLV